MKTIPAGKGVRCLFAVCFDLGSMFLNYSRHGVVSRSRLIDAHSRQFCFALWRPQDQSEAVGFTPPFFCGLFLSHIFSSRLRRRTALNVRIIRHDRAWPETMGIKTKATAAPTTVVHRNVAQITMTSLNRQAHDHNMQRPKQIYYGSHSHKHTLHPLVFLNRACIPRPV